MMATSLAERGHETVGQSSYEKKRRVGRTQKASQFCVTEYVSTATGGCPEDDRAGGMCGWLDGKKRVSRHTGREELRSG